MTTPLKYLKAVDDADLFAANAIAKAEEKIADDIEYLTIDSKDRDLALWLDLGVDSEIVLSHYEDVDIEERDLEWTVGLAAMTAAAATQAFLDNRNDTVVEPLAYREQTVGTIVTTKALLISAAKRTVDYVPSALVDIVPLQAKFLSEFAFINEMSTAEAYESFRQIDALQQFDHVVTDQMGYVGRMTNYKKGSAQWKEEVASLTDSNSKAFQKKATRRSSERIYSWREAKGDVETLMVWVGEADKKACSYCKNNYGEVYSYADWLIIGLPGAETCAGGDYCRCHLAAIE